MSLAWRGAVTRVRQRLADHKADRVVLSAGFQVYDDAAPALVLDEGSEDWEWPLEAFDGKTPAEIRDMILDEGLLVDPIEPPPGSPPGTPPWQPPPDPPPLRERGAAFLEDFTDGGRPLELPLPYVFGA